MPAGCICRGGENLHKYQAHGAVGTKIKGQPLRCVLLACYHEHGAEGYRPMITEFQN